MAKRELPRVAEVKRVSGAAIRGLRDFVAYYDEHFGAPLTAIIRPTPRERVLISLVQCARSLVIGLSAMDDLRAFRAHATVARSLWEHYIDLRIIQESEGDDLARRYVAFVDIQRWNRTRRMQRERETLGLPPDPDVDMLLQHEAYRSASQKAVATYWPEVGFENIHRIRSWDGRTIAERAAEVGDEHAVFYRDLYSFFSWSSHASLAGIAGMPYEHLQQTACAALRNSLFLFGEMTEKLLGELNLGGVEHKNMKVIIDRFRAAESPDSGNAPD